ncbi:xanthine dehydrogenase accessory factor [Hydrogenoanaerobacterium saccharovorans]|uniref:Xanthine dehydrogenase accessory factor n=1 Tax=Hydrogenoanaerobacterium saccharovorans TaxID=474960 RepID=A0A1H7Z1M6_9FIRM|nr:selenium-dependent molybdenum cofactor biosynthesis protein YqeB [Hydrogenoanaerobacterium saccharovorans]RPF48887.1 xanthine dehydrogenase accessory factor [Hydrogenoanaerobacterium saccharovorans]SEM52071.1 xanthine dehydrogenase accessory factor [Hydrogenoanaerobacterium saccharovorans]
MLILIKGAGDLATGVACRLKMCGFDVVMTETAKPTTVRRTVAFSRAVYEQKAVVEGITASLCTNLGEVWETLRQNEVAIVVDPEAEIIKELHPQAVIDAIIAKKNINTSITDAPAVVALGPGFTAGVDCHAVIETKRGHNLGRVLYKGSAAANTGIPGNIAGFTSERILRACCDGIFTPVADIGDMVKAGDVVATVGSKPVYTNIDGIVRGMLPPNTPVFEGMKSGDVDPRGIYEYCFTVSDKARAIAGGVLEAVLHITNEVNKYE